MAHQLQAKWENLYEFAMFSAASDGWLREITGEQRLLDYGNTLSGLFKHLHSQRHQNVITKRSEVKRMLAKGNIHREAVRGSAITKEKRHIQNRRVIVKLMKSTYFLCKKKWAARENFNDFIKLIAGDMGDQDISVHLGESSQCSTYTCAGASNLFRDFVQSARFCLFITSMKHCVSMVT